MNLKKSLRGNKIVTPLKAGAIFTNTFIYLAIIKSLSQPEKLFYFNIHKANPFLYLSRIELTLSFYLTLILVNNAIFTLLPIHFVLF